MKSTREHYAYCKYCKQDLSIQHGGRDEHAYIQQTGVSKWAGTRYFYPPEMVYSTGRNYWTPKISGGQNHKYDGR